jgi:hypothetical protein
MTGIHAVSLLKEKFKRSGLVTTIPLLKGGSFKARLVTGGLEVDNLGNLPFLPWSVFEETVCIITRNGGRAERGDAMRSRLGDPGLPLNSVEGHIAHIVYGKIIGETVFRRISPIASILIWAGICRAEPRTLVLADME